jgi:hypothetical protein
MMTYDPPHIFFCLTMQPKRLKMRLHWLMRQKT